MEQLLEQTKTEVRSLVDGKLDQLHKQPWSEAVRECGDLLIDLERAVLRIAPDVDRDNFLDLRGRLTNIFELLDLAPDNLPSAVSILKSVNLHMDNMLHYDGFIDRPLHPDFRVFQEITEELEFDQATVEKGLNSFTKFILVGSAIQHRCETLQSRVMKGLAEVFTPAYYFLLEGRRAKRNRQFYNDIQVSSVRRLWNMVEQGISGTLAQFIMPFISYNKFISLPSAPIFTSEYVQEQERTGCLNSKNQQPFHYCPPPQASLFERKDHKISVRVLCDSDIEHRDSAKTVKNVIFHIPGGGFIACSSYSHQFYTRRWARELDAVVFSIDYKKAPEHPYPIALDQIFQTYLWIVHEGSRHLNYEPRRVVVVGDSAGGNLTAALTGLCIKFGVRVPDSILLFYPALSVSFKAYLPSTFIALTDPFLNHDMLRLCVESYCSEHHDGDKDPFISPNLLSDELLREFPPARIFLGSRDAVGDQSKVFGVRLRKLGRKVRLRVYRGLPHAFLNFDMPMGLQESRECVGESLVALQEIFV